MRKLHQAIFNDNWPIRRKWLRFALLWMGLNVQYLIIWGTSELHTQVAMTMLGAIVALLTAYIFGSNQNDKDKYRWLHHSDESRFDSERDDQEDLTPMPPSVPPGVM